MPDRKVEHLPLLRGFATPHFSRLALKLITDHFPQTDY
jgi:hypothetical protein